MLCIILYSRDVQYKGNLMSDITPGLLTPEHASSETLVGNELILGGVSTKSIIQLISEKSPKDGLITLGSIAATLETVEQIYDLTRGDSTFLDDLVLMASSVVNPYLETEDDWLLKNWVLQEGLLIGAGGYTDNFAQINHTKFTKKGLYFLTITVAQLPSGNIDLMLNDTWLGRIQQTGTYLKEVEIADIINDRLYLELTNVTANENVIISSVALYYLAPRFVNYVEEKVRSLATVDATKYISKEEFSKYTEDLIIQFQQATNQYLESLAQHQNAINPHKITCELINAAPAEHEHSNYLTKSELEQSVADQMKNYALKEHDHDDTYVKRDEVESTVGELISSRISELVTVDPLIITNAPSGILPSRYAHTDITPPLTILLPTTVHHNGVSSYDYNYGLITTNREELMTLAPKVFNEHVALPEDVDFTTPVNFRICYHTKHKISGYRMECAGKTVTDWSVYSGNTTFIHRVKDPTTYVTEDNYQVCEVFFDNVQEVESLAFIISAVSDTVDPLTLQIKILYEDFEEQSFGITNQSFSFCIPDKATNRIVTLEEEVEPLVVTPDVVVADTPCFIFARKELGEATTTILPTYIAPEYATICKGLDVLENKFLAIDKIAGETKEIYEHPAFGTLTLTQGYSDEGHTVKKIYDTSESSWYTNGDDTTVIITQTFKSTHVILRSYLLNWRKEDVDSIPDSWTITVQGTDKEGRQITQIVDSVEQYYPFYSVEDDDIVYHAEVDCDLMVSSITLTMTSTVARKLALNKAAWYINEMYYSIPQNTMYYGLEKVAASCLGYAVYTEGKGWTPTNLCLGKSVVIPINNLERTDKFATYIVPNPFFTTSVIASVQSYALTPDDISEQDYPAAYVSNVTPDHISITTAQSFCYAVSITRAW